MTLRFSTWEERSHQCFTVDLIGCLLSQDYLHAFSVSRRKEEKKKKGNEVKKENSKCLGPCVGEIFCNKDFLPSLESPFTGKQAYHNGIDIATSGTSPEIYAVAGGEVVTAGGNAYTGYGYYVIIDHGGGFQSLYGHMNKWPSVSAGDMVKQGQLIGYVGTTGRSTGKHLHFTLYKNGADVNPLNYLPN